MLQPPGCIDLCMSEPLAVERVGDDMLGASGRAGGRAGGRRYTNQPVLRHLPWPTCRRGVVWSEQIPEDWPKKTHKKNTVNTGCLPQHSQHSQHRFRGLANTVDTVNTVNTVNTGCPPQRGTRGSHKARIPKNPNKAKNGAHTEL